MLTLIAWAFTRKCVQRCLAIPGENVDDEVHVFLCPFRNDKYLLSNTIIMKKTLLCALLALMMPVVADAYDFELDGIYYNKNSDDMSVIVTYKTTSNRGYSGSVVIPSTVAYNNKQYSVTSIGNYAFNGCSGLTSITIPNSVTKIGDYAFKNCSDLTSITIPNSVTSIGYDAFSGTTWYNNQPDGLIYAGKVAYMYKGTMPEGTHIELEDGTLVIAARAFYNCSGLTSITIPNSVTSIGVSAFNNCSGLTSITIPNNVTGIGDYAFSGCTGLTSVTIPNSVTSIGEAAFAYCRGLLSVRIDNSVTSIGNKAFYECSSLSSLSIGNNVTSIGNEAFYNCRSLLTSITIPNSVTSIGHSAFYNCFVLSSVIIGNNVTSIGNHAFYNCCGLKSITIPNSVTSLGNYAFYACEGLTSVTLGNSVESIGSEAFRGCSGLTSVTLGNNVESIGEYAFSGCSSLPSVTIPNSVTSIGISAFSYCSSLTSITIPNNVTSIGNYAFDGCRNLKSVTFGSNMSVIGAGAFYNCSSLKSVTIPESVTKIGSSAFYGCCSLTSVNIPNSVTSIGSSTFYNCSGLRSVTIPNSVTSIGEAAFRNCSGLTSIAIPNSVTSIGNSTFHDCSALTLVTIPDNLTYIGNSAFRGCKSLTSINIPNSVTNIGNYAFYQCSTLTSINIPNSVISIGEQALSYCPNIEDIIVEPGNQVYDSRNSCKAIVETAKNALVLGCKYSSIPNDVTEIFSRAFCGMGSNMCITVPVSVSKIRTNAFCDFDRLNVSFVGAAPPEIEDKAFSNSTVSATVPRGSSIAYSSFGFAEVNENKDDFPLVSINLTEAGMLQDKLLDLDDTDIRRLKISGFITASDISYLRSSSRLSNLKYLDISEITLVPSNEPYAEFAIGVKYGNGGTSGGSYARFYISEEEKNELVYSNPNGLGGSNQVHAYYSRTLAGAFAEMNLEYVIIPPSFDRVGAFCFKSNKNLKEVSLPNNSDFKYIDEFAFTSCESLEELLLPSSVIFIGAGAFYGCKMLNNIGRLDNVKCLGKSSFSNCVSLRNIGSLASVEILDYGTSNLFLSCFSGCTSLVGDVETGILDLSSCNNIPKAQYSGEGTFSGCSSLQKVKFSKDLKSIGSYAFSGCTNINSITLPEGLETIGAGAFSSCSNLTTASIPTSLLHVSSGSFTDTPFEQTFDLDNGVRYMKDIAMSASSSSSISFREGTRSIADGFIYSQPENCKSITLPSTLQCIGENSFSGVGITSLSLPESLKYIGSKAFYNCTSLSGTLTIPENVSFIGGSAFSDCSGVAVVNYNANTREGAGNYVFGYCTGVDKVTIGPKVEVIPEEAFIRSNIYKLVFAERTDAIPLKIGNAAFFENKNIKEIILPNGTDSIGQQAFDCCFGLTSVTIPNSVTCIGNSAFYGCSALTSVICQARNVPAMGRSCFTSVPQSSATLYVPSSSIEAYKSADQWKSFGTILPIAEGTSYNITATANPANSGRITGAGSYQDGATVTLTATPAEGYEFTNWTENGTTVSTQATYTFAASQDRTLVANFQKTDEGNSEIYYSFNTSNNTATVVSGENKYTGDVVIPESVTYQGTTYAVTSIGNSAFEECTDLTSITFGNNVRSIGYASFDGCRNLKSVTFGSNMSVIGDWAFYRCSGLPSVTIPNSVTSVGEGAFSYCSGMKLVTIGNGVTSIGNSAFSYCSDLTSVTIGNSVRSIGNSAFVGCSSLTSVVIPNSVTSIASGIFWGCTSLKTVTIPNSVESIGSDAFSGCESLTTVTLNANSIVSKTYTAGSNLKSIFGSQVTEYILGNDVTGIGEYAFHGCSDLTSVTIPGLAQQVDAHEHVERPQPQVADNLHALDRVSCIEVVVPSRGLDQGVEPVDDPAVFIELGKTYRACALGHLVCCLEVDGRECHCSFGRLAALSLQIQKGVG